MIFLCEPISGSLADELHLRKESQPANVILKSVAELQLGLLDLSPFIKSHKQIATSPLLILPLGLYSDRFKSTFFPSFDVYAFPQKPHGKG